MDLLSKVEDHSKVGEDMKSHHLWLRHCKSSTCIEDSDKILKHSHDFHNETI